MPIRPVSPSCRKRWRARAARSRSSWTTTSPDDSQRPRPAFRAAPPDGGGGAVLRLRLPGAERGQPAQGRLYLQYLPVHHLARGRRGAATGCLRQPGAQPVDGPARTGRQDRRRPALERDRRRPGTRLRHRRLQRRRRAERGAARRARNPVRRRRCPPEPLAGHRHAGRGRRPPALRYRYARGGAGQLAAALSALVFAGAILLGYEWVSLRGALADETRMQAAIVAENVAAPLMFGDQDAAGEMLASLRNADQLRSALLYSRDGQRFASFGARRTGPVEAEPAFGELAVTQQVAYRGQVLGRLVLVTGTDRILTGLLRYAGLLALASLGGLLLVTVVMHRTRARVAVAERELHYLANTDPVTGLHNRRATYASLERAIAVQAGQGGQVAVLLIDLDNFKVINDTAGHAAGDVLLQHVAAALGTAICERAVVGRIGGDEFAIIAPVADEAAAQAIGEAIVAALRDPFLLETGEVFATASVGLCLYPRDAAGMTELLSRADTALYRAKSAGRNRMAVFVPEMTLAMQRRAQMETELRKAIETGA